MARLTQIRANVVSLVDRAAVRDPSNPTEPQRLLLWKAEGGSNQTTGGDMPTAEETALIEKAEKERDEALAKAEKLEAQVAELEKAAETTEPDTDPLSKADIPAAVREHIAKQDAEVAELRKSAQESADIAKAERDARVTSEFVALAKSDFPNVGGDPSEFGPVLKAASENLSKEQFDTLKSRLTASEAQVAKGDLFKSYGQDGQPVAERSDALQKAEEKASELRKADPSLSRSDAFKQAMRAPDIAAAYRAEQDAA